LTWWSVWLQLGLLTAVITFAGSRLSKYGEVLAEKTGMGRTWIGLVLLAAVTSLPEFSTGVSSVWWVDAPDITVGDLLGSCVFNLLILAVVDLLHPPGPILTAASRGHLLAAAFGVIMLGVAALGILGPPFSFVGLPHLGLGSLVLMVCYLVAMRAVFRFQRRERVAYLAEPEAERRYAAMGLRQAELLFGLNALAVVGAGAFLPRVATDLAHLMGWQQSLVGTIFVAASTSLPEVVVILSALRMGAVDLAVGNLFGSNLFNLGLLGLMDALYFKAPLLRTVAPEHAGTALLAILMTGIASVELIYRPPKKALRVMSAAAFLLAFLYAANVFFQMLARAR
jgi:cation:H+ antiporter